MKTPVYSSLIILVFLSSCSPKITTTLTRSYPPIDYRTDIAVFGLTAAVPAGAEVLGTIKIGDTGFSTNCGFDVAVDKAKIEARKAGGNAIKITEHKPPSVMGSSCHRITAAILRTSGPVSESVAIKEHTGTDPGYSTICIYRHPGKGGLVNFDLFLGDSVICRVTNNFRTTIQTTKEGYISLWAKTESKTELPLNLKHGSTYYVRCSIAFGIAVGRPFLELVENEMGKPEFESILTRNK